AQLTDATSKAKQDGEQRSQQLQTKISQLELGLTSQLQGLSQSSGDKIELLQRQVGKSRRQWLIAEAEYLSRLANTRLQLVGDVDTAIIALQSADQRLKENGDPLTFDIRLQLAKEINSLKSTKVPDTVGISSQLIALENAVSQMDITEAHAGTAQAPAIGKGEASAIPENIQQTLNDAWSNFSKLVVVRRHDKPVAALMTPEQVELIRKNLALKLEAARLALINKNEALYRASIAISMDWLADYFDANNPAVKTAIEQLNTLKNTPIKAHLPSIALSLKMLRDLPLLTINEQNVIAKKQSPPADSHDTSADEKTTTPAVDSQATSSAEKADTPPADKIEASKPQDDSAVNATP
ncbi:MAG: uroporphyrinogen-III C-methyltransferase, partial [Deltaproteobacteria bacterium]|nr:uroporphyrinogen-III C-methyltransferase [Deltaproteobacteria bacterium]